MARVKIGNVYPSDAYLLERCAPAGFGLGGSGRHFDIKDIDDFKNSGWYYSTDAYGHNVDGFPMYYILLRVDSWWETAGFNTVVQTVYYDGLEARRFCQLDGWRPWEWVNPPMMDGVEYRTTERWRGKTVYTRLIDCGALPASGRLPVYIGEMVNIIRYAASCDCCAIPYRDLDTNGTIDIAVENTYIIFTVNVDEVRQTAMGTAYVQIWYTKN
jgi:hypothetical protein